MFPQDSTVTVWKVLLQANCSRVVMRNGFSGIDPRIRPTSLSVDRCAARRAAGTSTSSRTSSKSSSEMCSASERRVRLPCRNSEMWSTVGRVT
jgi:hypothetical protein